MRLIVVLSEKDMPRLNPIIFSAYLTSVGIDNKCDWVSDPDKKEKIAHIWVYEEDLTNKAKDLFSSYVLDPNNQKYSFAYNNYLSKFSKLLSSSQETLEILHSKINNSKTKIASLYENKKKRRFSLSFSSLIFITILSVFAIQKSQSLFNRSNLVESHLFFDLPRYFEKQEPIKDDKLPLWVGAYNLSVHHNLSLKQLNLISAPMFEKIKQGQIWRIFTPTFIHSDIFYLFLNCIFFFLLSNQIEEKIGYKKIACLFFLISGINNLFLYLFFGPFFMGFSSICFGFLGFVWARQNNNPHENYNITKHMGPGFFFIMLISVFFNSLSFLNIKTTSIMTLTIIESSNIGNLFSLLSGYFFGTLFLFKKKI